jgi:hypothetical protein
MRFYDKFYLIEDKIGLDDRVHFRLPFCALWHLYFSLRDEHGIWMNLGGHSACPFDKLRAGSESRGVRQNLITGLNDQRHEWLLVKTPIN